MSDAQLRALERAARDTPPRSLEREQWLAARRRVGQVLTRRTWTTKDGRTLRIVDLGDTHLVNCIRFLIRGYGRVFLTPDERQWSSEARAILRALRKEARQRGLAFDYSDVTVEQALTLHALESEDQRRRMALDTAPVARHTPAH